MILLLQLSKTGRSEVVNEERWGVQGRSQGLRARGAGATMPFELPILSTSRAEKPHDWQYEATILPCIGNKYRSLFTDLSLHFCIKI
jgi:hypothetical protein